MKVKTLSVITAIPLLSLALATTPAFAQSSAQQTIGIVAQEQLSTKLPVRWAASAVTNQQTTRLSSAQIKQIEAGIAMAHKYPLVVQESTSTTGVAASGPGTNMIVRSPGGGGAASIQITLTHIEMNFILTAGVLAATSFIAAGIIASGVATVESGGSDIVVAGTILSRSQFYNLIGTIIGGITSVAWIWEPQGNVTLSIPDTTLTIGGGPVYLWDNNSFSTIYI